MRERAFCARMKRFGRFSIASAIVGLFLLTFMIFCPQVGSEQDVNAYINADKYGLTLTYSPTLNVNANVADGDSFVIVKDTIKATTSSPSGYSLYISSSSDSNILQAVDFPEADNTKFVPLGGTQILPVALNSSEKSAWGYAVPGLYGFDSSYNTESPLATSKFAAVPTLENAELIHSHEGTAEEIETDVYFGFRVNADQQTGNYNLNIAYTSLVEITPEEEGTLEVEPNLLKAGYEDTRIKIKTSYNNTNSTIKIDGPISVKLVENPSYYYEYAESYYSSYYATTPEQYDPNSIFNCEDPEIVSYEPLTVECIVPAGRKGGLYDVHVSIPSIGKSYHGIQKLTIQEDPEQFIAYFDANGGYDAPNPIAVTPNDYYDYKQAYLYFPQYSPLRDGYRFLGWSTCKEYDQDNWIDGCNFFDFTAEYPGARTGGFGYYTHYTYLYEPETTFYAVWEQILVNLDFDMNGGEGSVDRVVSYDNYFKLPTKNLPTREGYEFIGWSYDPLTHEADFKYNKQTNSYDTCQANDWEYYDSERRYIGECYSGYTLSAYEDFTLYAVWNRPIISSINDAVYMQDMNSSVMKSMEEEKQYQLIDSRDGKKYWISKLKDGNVWMTQNLDYDVYTHTSEYGGAKGGSGETDIAATVQLPVSIWGSYAHVNYLEGGDYYIDTDGNLQSTDGLAEDSEEWHHHIGDYYTTGMARFDSGSVCPRGWRLPRSESYNSAYYYIEESFSSLLYKYGLDVTNKYEYTGDEVDNTLTSAPLYFTKAGNVAVENNNPVLKKQGQHGSYTTGQQLGGLEFENNKFGIYAYKDETQAFSVRCVAWKDYTINYDMNYEGGEVYVKTSRDPSPAVWGGDTRDALPYREGYDFVGWAFDKNSTTPDYGFSRYGSIQPFYVNINTEYYKDEVTLYALWEDRSILYMQNPDRWSPDLEIGEEIELIDRRDGKTYLASRLEDGSVWMTQNLDFDLDNTVAYDSRTTMSRNDYTPTNSTIKDYSALSTEWGDSYTTDYSFDPGDYYYDGVDDPDAEECNYITESCEHFSTTPFENGKHGHVGNYYDFTAIIAESSLWVNGRNNQGWNFCPSGWEVSSGPGSRYDNEGDWNYLVDAYGNKIGSLTKSPLNLVRAGYIDKDGLHGASKEGYYATDTSSSEINYYAMKFDTAITQDVEMPRNIGMTVRCYLSVYYDPYYY